MNCCRKEPDDAQEQLKRSRAIDRVLEEDRIRIRRKVRMLLLGPGESGKSTILKQMKIIYQNGYTEQERVAFRFPVYRCILDSVKLLIEAMRRFEIALENPENRQHCDLIMDAEIGSDPEKACLNAGVTEAIESFWRDPCIPKVLERSNQFYLSDSAPYFIDDIQRISSADYIPTESDILRARSKTTGMAATAFFADGMQFEMIELGGARTERRKWIHFFEEMTAVIFCVAMSDYDQLLSEDSSQNRMTETLTLFDSIVNSRWFTKSVIILFLNKIDLFRKKIPLSPLNNYFPDCPGGDDVNEAAQYLLSRFVAVNNETHRLYAHYTCATDTTHIRFVFLAVQDSIISCSFRACVLF